MDMISPEPSAGRLQINEIDLCGCIGHAAPGVVVEYHRGFLALDLVPQVTRLSDRDRLELARVARRAWWAADRGLVHLVQRRLGPGAFAYLAVVRPKPRHAAISLSSLLQVEPA
jgi:hypothetical protein